ncbi:MAG: acyl-phosphate glycerol 3-phosphate acyltransferase [Verrucomicrobia bacterium]|nr:MAG: acyl-phosphate glycerol 3-phosphate acyltransferase [Verrucomicrobiota bacterium]
MPIVGYILAAISGYLLGSIPTGFLFGKARGIDIRSVGSGNIGATNVVRALGKPAGAFVLLADALKGWLAVVVTATLLSHWFSPIAGVKTVATYRIIAGTAAILGHNYTCWLNFKGGKGIATSAGVLLALVPLAVLISVGAWILTFLLGRYVSLASIVAAFVMPFAVWLTPHQIAAMIYVTAALAALAIYKHRANIKRLLNGTESRFFVKRAAGNVNREM